PLPGPPFSPILAPLSPKIVRRGPDVEFEYIDGRGYRDVLKDKAALCDAAGCRCQGPALTCGHTDGAFYNPLLAQVYAEMCFHTCHCDIMPPALGDGIPIRVGDIFVVGTRQGNYGPVNGVHSDARALGTNGCLKGEANGWTLQKYASKSCCPDTNFHALTPQEAYTNFKVAPMLKAIITGSVTIGVSEANNKAEAQQWSPAISAEGIHREGPQKDELKLVVCGSLDPNARMSKKLGSRSFAK
ncbi:MAG: hypothetical protein Q9181_005247, partial [Wetmoreana brouardii]